MTAAAVAPPGPVWGRKPSRLRRLRPEEAAYLAGIIDGEGCIGTQRYERKRTGRYFTCMLTVISTDAGLVEWLQGTGAGVTSKPKRRPNRAQAYCWRTYGGEAAHVLETIHRFLIIKARQALLAIWLERSPRHAWERIDYAVRISRLNSNKGGKASRSRHLAIVPETP